MADLHRWTDAQGLGIPYPTLRKWAQAGHELVLSPEQKLLIWAEEGKYGVTIVTLGR